MKDNRFIELVNLYIDRQITAAETAELEAEMQGNPRRRAIYRQYCQLHSATKRVYDSFRATDPQAVAPVGRAGITRFDNRPRTRWVHFAGGLVAAACLTLVFVRYSSNSRPAVETVARVEPGPAVPAVVAAPVVAAPAPSLSSLRNNSATTPDHAELLATLRAGEQRPFSGIDLQSNRLPSLFDDGVFENRPVFPINGQRSFRSKHTPAQPAEFTAFQFQR